MTAEALAIRPAGTQPDQLAAYCGLLNAAFATDTFTAEGLAWRYRDNPAGQVVGADAWDGARLAAHYVTCPLEAPRAFITPISRVFMTIKVIRVQVIPNAATTTMKNRRKSITFFSTTTAAIIGLSSLQVEIR